MTYEQGKEEARALALTNWDEFCRRLKPDLTKFYVCRLKSEGKSYQQIANRLEMPKSTVQSIVRKCDKV